MQNINTFLEANPTEVIVFIYQVNSAVDQPVDLNAFYDRMALVDGFLDKLYVHPGSNTTWPTLGELTDSATNKVSIGRILRRLKHSFVALVSHSLSSLFKTKACHHVPLQRSELQRVP